MSTKSSEILNQALALSVEERADLAGQLIESADRAETRSVKGAWDAEIERRMAELDASAVQPVSMDEAFRRLHAASEAKQVSPVPPTKLARGGASVEELKQAARKILEGPERWPESSKGTCLAKLPCFPFAAALGHRRREYWKNGL